MMKSTNTEEIPGLAAHQADASATNTLIYKQTEMKTATTV